MDLTEWNDLWRESFASELEDDDLPQTLPEKKYDMSAMQNFKKNILGGLIDNNCKGKEIRTDREPASVVTWKIYSCETIAAPGFTICKYTPWSKEMIGKPEIEQMEEERKRQLRQRHIDTMRHVVTKKEPQKEEYDSGYPFETVGELVQAMMREAFGDAVKIKQVQKWADELRKSLAGNLWGYNAKRAAEEARRAAQETKPDKKPEPERRPVKGADNLLTIAGISSNGKV